MKHFHRTLTFSAFLILPLAGTATAQISSSVSIPTGGGAVQTNTPDSKVKIVPKNERKANRAARKAAQARKDSKVGAPDSQETQPPVNPSPEVSGSPGQ
ncbi:MAG: hypothetical protein H7249_07230 [Chitinophagaceae bacterium]|nr:hypothetical protein [Oligoflexus sp.]